MDIVKELFEMQDTGYRDFQAPLIPDIPKEKIIGVRTPELKRFAKRLLKEGRACEITDTLPHTYFEENQLHGFIISELRDPDTVIEELDRFLPFVDNWATCDQINPRIFARYTDRLYTEICRCISSEHTYTVRFGLRMLMKYYLDERFDPSYLRLAAGIKSDEYYVNMMIAWYFAEALAKQYDSAVKIIEEGCLDKWVHNKAVQKARESFRIPEEHKEYLKKLKK